MPSSVSPIDARRFDRGFAKEKDVRRGTGDVQQSRFAEL